MSKELKIITVIIAVMAILLLAILIFIKLDKKNQDRCYNLPLNEFYGDKSCLRYKEVLR